MAEAVQVVQRPADGALAVSTPLAGPHTPASPEMGAVQLALLPPLAPAQVHVHGPEPETTEALPAVQRPEVGALATAAPSAGPHAALTVQVSDAGGVPE
jgi:hypothetical protein